MKKGIAYILSVLYYLCFGLTLVIFHGIQWVCFNVFGYKAHKKSVDILNFFLLKCLNVIGTRFIFNNPYTLDKNVPHIIVSNHQSLYDISPLSWFFRDLHPKFVSKKELGKGIPSVSYNLTHGGSILIDRKNPRQALPELKKFGKFLNKTNYAAVIFPEGTRSKNGRPRKFQTTGLKILFKTCPNAVVVPVTINNAWQLQKYGGFPLHIGTKLVCTVQQPIPLKDRNIDEVIAEVEESIKNDIIINN